MVIGWFGRSVRDGRAEGGAMAGAETGAAIRLEGLEKRFGDRVAVAGLDLAVAHGELFSLLGPNGAGKTTTIRMLCCLLSPTSGTGSVMGHDIRDDPFGVKQVIGVSPQETAVAPNLTGWENLALMAGLHGLDRTTSRRRAEELMEVFGLRDRAGERAKRYSGGMQRRLSLAMALVSDPQVVFLDEPTIGLDPQSRRGLWDYIAGLKGNTTIVLTTHYLEEADALADRIAVIDDGSLVAVGTPDELKAGVTTRSVMLVEASDIGDEAFAALRTVFPTARRVERGVEIEGDHISVYDVGDCLRPFGVEIRSTSVETASLDDVFLQLTGKEMRS
jgi:ABC-2 type transport system ATP-binding protein